MTNFFNNSQMTKLPNWSVIKISGLEVENFLQGQLTCDVNTVSEGQASLASLCNHQGRVQAVFLLFKKNNDFYALLPSSISEHFINHLNKFAVFSKTLLMDVTASYSLIAFLGDEVEILIESYFPNLPSQAYQVITENDFTLCKLPGVTSCYLAWGPVEQENRFVNLASENLLWQVTSILSAWPFIDDQTMSAVTPHMLNLHNLNAISFNKGCYVGQEIVARTHYLGKAKRQLYLLTFENNSPINSGDLVTVASQEVGIIINSVTYKASNFALAVIQEDAVEKDLFCNNERVVGIIKATDLEPENVALMPIKEI